MKIVRSGEASKEMVEHPLFTGPGVTRQELAPGSQEFNVNLVSFPQGVRNKFHAHSNEQVLIVIAGRGIVASEEEEHEVTVGDVIVFSAGEKHWHGATADSDFAHIYVTQVGTETTQLED
ncbi:MAG: cupin domain-containing protein [Pseudomonadota bacterium]